MRDLETFIGLEIHIHLLTATKMFCACRNHFGDEPNSNVCPVCSGWPGVLPAVNAEAVELGYRVARALRCRLETEAYFDRKSYYYPDMPKNYQISQFHHPIGRGGQIEFPMPDGSTRSVRMRECHLEEDAGKLIHSGDITLIDYNRAGVPLLEIVTEPDLKSGEEAEAYIQYFQRLVRYLGVSDGNMEEGSLRCDANLSLNDRGAGLGTKVEVKNLNSSRFVKLSLNYEVGRQTELLESGGAVRQETRLWNENRDATSVMRSKESSEDYRYFPEPDLPPFRPDDRFLARVEAAQPELPLARRERLRSEYGLSPEQAEVIHESRALADYFEDAVLRLGSLAGGGLGSKVQAAALLAPWLLGDVKKELNRRDLKAENSPMTSSRLASLMAMLAAERIHGKIAKQVVLEVFESNKDPESIVSERGLEQLSKPGDISPYVDRVFAANAKVVEEVRSGDAKKKEFLIGRVMAETQGRASPVVLRALVEERLAK